MENFKNADNPTPGLELHVTHMYFLAKSLTHMFRTHMKNGFMCVWNFFVGKLN